MLKPGDVVTAWFPGIAMTKRRPLVVVSTDAYHATRPDVVVAELTSQVAKTKAQTDYLLQDWQAAGLHSPSAFRVFLATLPASNVTVIGHLSDADWAEVQARLRLGLAVQ
jgi:mRNA interferase MazF